MLDAADSSEKLAAFVAAAASRFWLSVIVNSKPLVTTEAEVLATTTPVRSTVIVNDAVVTLPAASMASNWIVLVPSASGRKSCKFDGDRRTAARERDLRLAIGEPVRIAGGQDRQRSRTASWKDV